MKPTEAFPERRMTKRSKGKQEVKEKTGFRIRNKMSDRWGVHLSLDVLSRKQIKLLKTLLPEDA